MRIDISAIRMEHDLEKKNYFKGLYFLERGLYKKAIYYFKKGVNSRYQNQCLKGIIFSLVLNNKFDRAKKVYKKYQEIFIRADDQIDILYIHFYLGMYNDNYRRRFSLLEEWSMRPCDFQVMIASIYKAAGYGEARMYGKYYIEKIKNEMELTYMDYFLYRLSFVKGIMRVGKNHYMYCMITA